MLNLVARTKDRETVLLLEWQRGRVLALYPDGRLAELGVSEVKVDLIEAATRLTINQRQNEALLEEAVADQ